MSVKVVSRTNPIGFRIRLPKTATAISFTGKQILDKIPQDKAIKVQELIEITHPHLSPDEQHLIKNLLAHQLRIAGKNEEILKPEDLELFINKIKEKLEAKKDPNFKSDELTSLLFESFRSKTKINITVDSERFAVEIIDINPATLGLLEFEGLKNIKGEDRPIVLYEFGLIAHEHKDKVSEEEWTKFCEMFSSSQDYRDYRTFLKGYKSLRLNSSDDLMVIMQTLSDLNINAQSFPEYMSKILAAGKFTEEISSLIQDVNYEIIVNLKADNKFDELMFLFYQALTKFNQAIQAIIINTLIDSGGDAIPFLLEAAAFLEGKNMVIQNKSILDKINRTIKAIIGSENSSIDTTKFYQTPQTPAYDNLISIVLDYNKKTFLHKKALDILFKNKHSVYALLNKHQTVEKKERKIITAIINQFLDQNSAFFEDKISDILRFLIQRATSKPEEVAKFAKINLNKGIYKAILVYFNLILSFFFDTNVMPQQTKLTEELTDIHNQRIKDYETLTTRSRLFTDPLRHTYKIDIFIQAIQILALRHALEDKSKKAAQIAEAMENFADKADLAVRIDVRYIPCLVALYNQGSSPSDRSLEELKIAMSKDRNGLSGLYIAMDMVQGILGAEIYTSIERVLELRGKKELFPEFVAFGNLLRSAYIQKRYDQVHHARKLLIEFKSSKHWNTIQDLVKAHDYDGAEDLIGAWLKNRS